MTINHLAIVISKPRSASPEIKNVSRGEKSPAGSSNAGGFLPAPIIALSASLRWRRSK